MKTQSEMIENFSEALIRYLDENEDCLTTENHYGAGNTMQGYVTTIDFDFASLKREIDKFSKQFQKENKE